MLKNVIFRSVAVAVCLLAGAVCASAQRWTPGRPSLDAQVVFGEGMDYKGVGVNGGVITWNTYQYIGKFSFGLDYYTHPYDFVRAERRSKNGDLISPEESFTFRAHDVTAGGGYFLRVLSTRNRALMFSVGLSAYAGIRYCKEISGFERGEDKPNFTLSEDGSGKKYNAVGFLLNIIPEAQLEVFPFSNVSLFLSARPRLQVVNGLVGKYDWFRFTWGFGAKYYF